MLIRLLTDCAEQEVGCDPPTGVRGLVLQGTIAGYMGHMESAKLCCRSHLAAELKLEDWSGEQQCATPKEFSLLRQSLVRIPPPQLLTKKKSTDSGAPAAKPNAAKARERLQQLLSGSTLSSNKDIRILQPDGSQNTSTVSAPGQATITITTSSGNTTFHDATHGSTPLKTKIFWRRPNC